MNERVKSSMEQRLDRLERHNRLLRIAALAAAAALALQALVGLGVFRPKAVGAEDERTPAVVRAKRIEVVDSKGKVAAVLGLSNDGNPSLVLKGKDNSVVAMRIDSNGRGQVVVRDKNGTGTLDSQQKHTVVLQPQWVYPPREREEPNAPLGRLYLLGKDKPVAGAP